MLTLCLTKPYRQILENGWLESNNSHKKMTARSFVKNQKKFHYWHCILSDLKALKFLLIGLHCKPFTIFGRLIVNACFSFPCIA